MAVLFSPLCGGLMPSLFGSRFRGFCLLLWLCGLLQPPLAAAVLGNTPPPQVLVLNSYAQGYDWSDDELAGLLKVLNAGFRDIEPLIIHMDVRRYPLHEREEVLLAEIEYKCRKFPPVLLVTLDNAAFDFALRHRQRIAPGIPLVFGGLNGFDPRMLAGQDSVTGVSEESSYEGTFRLIRSLCPEARRIVAVSSSTVNGRETVALFRRQVARLGVSYDIEYYERWTNEQLFHRIATLPADTVGLLLETTEDITGHQNYRDGNFSETLYSQASRPLFMNSYPPGDNDWTVHPWGGLGGGMVRADLHGQKVGELAVRVLNGENASSIPVLVNTPEMLAVDYRHLRRFGLSVSSLPAGTVVYNEPASFYSIHRTRLVFAACVFSVLCLIVLLLSVNILRRQRAESALLAARAELDLVARAVSQASDVILIVGETGALRYSNPAFASLTGPREDLCTGWSFSSWVARRITETTFTAMASCAAGEGAWSGTLSLHDEQRRKQYLQCRMAGINNDVPAGERLFLFIARDITRERELEEQLRSSQKMEAIGLLAGGVAHDFNNLLQVIQGHASLLLDDLGQGSHVSDLLMIRDATARASQLTRQLLVFSRRQALNREFVDPCALFSEMLRMLRRLIGEHIEVHFTPSAEPVLLHADKGQLEQVLLNLCVNARDAMPGGGRLEISLSRVVFDAEDCEGLQGLSPGAHLELAVRDNGKGMSREILAHIFEPFFTTKPVGQGTGLGLPVVYGIVQNHRGALRVYSEPGAGTVFKIYLPLANGEPTVAVTPPEETLLRGEGCILLAEDEESVQSLARRTLLRHGYSVLVASDGQAALDLLRQHRSSVRLVILDVMMPKLSGRQVYDQLKVEHPRLPVLFCSGYSADMLPPDMAPEAGLAFITKPYAAREFLLAIQNLLKSSAGLQGENRPESSEK